MRIVITDTGNIWNPKNPFLVPFQEIVLVVCLNGEKVTDQYQCFVSPYPKKDMEMMGIDKYGAEDGKFRALASVARELNEEMQCHDDIIFLTDNVPSTLYPFYLVKDWNEHNKLHLVTMPPWDFEGKYKIKAHAQMLSDLTALNSILYYDSRHVLDAVKPKSTIGDAYGYARDELGKWMPKFMNGIYKMKNKPCFFDFASMTYVPLEGGFERINLSKKDRVEDEIIFPVQRELWTLGILYPRSYPADVDYVKDEVERPAARLDGKKVCNILREQRLRLAEANHIPFRSRECPSIGPCAGTCQKCDMEAEYLRKKLQKIPKEERVYPQFDPKEEMLP